MIYVTRQNARKFSPDGMKHADMRRGIENKPIKWAEYSSTQEKRLKLRLSNNFNKEV